MGESEAGNIFPKDQIDGRIHAKWRGDVNLDFKVVSAREKVQSQYERACAQKNELPEYEAEIDDEDSTEEVMPAKNMSRPPGNKDEIIHFKMPNGTIVLVPKRYALVSKQ